MRETISSLHINTEPTWRGGEQQTLYLLQGLVKRGFPVRLCAQRGSPMAARARESDIDTFELRMRGEIDVLAALRLRGQIKEFRPDIVHYHTSHAHSLGILATAFGGGRGARTLLTRRVDFSIYRHSFFGLNHIKYRKVDHIVAISQAIEKVLVSDGLPPQGIDCVPSGIDPARFANPAPANLRDEYGLPPETKIVGNVAYFADHKGQRYLVEAAVRILKECPDTAVFLIGEGELREPLMKLASELGVANRVLFPGFRRDVPAILGELDLYAMPSHKEGLGTSILDALWCGVPVVASDTGGMPEVVRHEVNGLLVPPRDTAALAEAIVRLLKNPEETARYRRAARKTIESNYTVDSMVEGNIAVYRKLLRGEMTNV